MLKRRTYWVYLSIWIAATLAVWATLVPAWVSAWTLGWVAAAGVVLSAAFVMIVREGQPTRSVAHVLYDTEHQTEGGR